MSEVNINPSLSNTVNNQITFNEVNVVTNETQIEVTQPVTNVIEVISFGPQGASSPPGGSNTQIQFNNNGAFGGVPSLVFDGITLRATGSFSGSFSGKVDGVLSISGSLVFEPQATPPPNPYGSIYFDGIDFFLGT